MPTQKATAKELEERTRKDYEDWELEEMIEQGEGKRGRDRRGMNQDSVVELDNSSQKRGQMRPCMTMMDNFDHSLAMHGTW